MWPELRLTARGSRDSVQRIVGDNNKMHLTFACGPYDRTAALREGLIRPEGIELNYLIL